MLKMFDATGGRIMASMSRGTKSLWVVLMLAGALSLGGCAGLVGEGGDSGDNGSDNNTMGSDTERPATVSLVFESLIPMGGTELGPVMLSDGDSETVKAVIQNLLNDTLSVNFTRGGENTETFAFAVTAAADGVVGSQTFAEASNSVQLGWFALAVSSTSEAIPGGVWMPVEGTHTISAIEPGSPVTLAGTIEGMFQVTTLTGASEMWTARISYSFTEK